MIISIGEVLYSGKVVDLLYGFEDNREGDSEDMTRIVMQSPEHLMDMFKHALRLQNTREGNTVLCFDLIQTDHRSGRLLVVDQGMEDDSFIPCVEGRNNIESSSICQMMSNISNAVMQLGHINGSSDSLRRVLGFGNSVALSIYCISDHEADHVDTSKYLHHSLSMQTKLPTCDGNTSVEGTLVSIHMRALKTRIASARQSVETLHADAEILHDEFIQLKKQKV